MTFTTSLCIKPFSSRHRPRQQDDPSSPKVGCLGQVRRCKAAEKNASPRIPQPPHSGGRHFYILMASVAFLVTPRNSKKRTRSSTTRPALMGRRVVAMEEIEPPLPVVVEEMDPPLPVASVGKKEREIETPALSLWKRRCRSRKLEELFFCSQENLPAATAGIVV